MSFNAFLAICNGSLFCSLIYRQVKVRRMEAALDERTAWLKYFAKNREWN
jgi:hypothetical protein